MKKILICFLIVLTLSSCKSSAVVEATETVVPVVTHEVRPTRTHTPTLPPPTIVLTEEIPNSDNDKLSDEQENNFGTSPLINDTDRDWLWDDVEVSVFGTDPKSPDTDGDSFADGFEVLIFGTNPLVADEDNDDDLVPNQTEERRGTDLSRDDTDNDTVSDFTEMMYGTDPLVNDTDADQVSDLAEINKLRNGEQVDPLFADFDLDKDGLSEWLNIPRTRCSSRNVDTDGDGVCDDYELLLGLDPANPDTDGDGFSDGWEFLMMSIWNFPLGIRTHPLVWNADYDGDTIPDSIELVFNLSVADPDVDGDGKTDGEELFKLFTDPVIPDS